MALGAAVVARVVIGRKAADCPMVGERADGLTELVGVANSQRVMGEEVGKAGEIVGKELHAGQDVGMNVSTVRIMAGGTGNADGAGFMGGGQRGAFPKGLPDVP